MADLATVQIIARVELDAEDLMRRYPPTFHNERKRMLLDRIALPVTGRVQVSRWRGDLPAVVAPATTPELEMRKDAFSYGPEEHRTVAWHLNFADAELFGYYSGPLLAQDEHQVLEHPVLGSLREALLDLARSRPELAPRTRDGEPTPYLVMGAQRSLSFDTIRGPYGNAFAAASPERILGAATFLDPPTISNILAVQAPPGGRGRYRREEIADVLRTAFVGFSACKLESGPLRCVVHAGNWGCGAYGGDPVLMALLQLCAARLAGVDRLVFHTFSRQFTESYSRALGLLEDLAPGPVFDTRGLVDRVHGLAFEWGRSDGN